MNKANLILTSIFLCVIIAICSGCSERNNIHTVYGVIDKVGVCNARDDSLFACMTVVDVSGSVEYWKVYGAVMEGQTIHKTCWDDDEGASWCNSVARQ